MYVNNNSVLPNYRAALLNTLLNVSDTKILCLGDSTTFGTGTTLSLGGINEPYAGAYPNALVGQLNGRGISSSLGLAVPPEVIANDDRWTAGTGWTIAHGSGPALSASFNATNPAGALVFNPKSATVFDSFIVYTAGGSGYATYTCTATGGTPVVITGGTLSPAGVQATVVTAAAANASNTLSITMTGFGIVVGVEPVLSTTKRVRVGNCGVPGASSVDYTQIGATAAKSLNSIAAYDPDLTIISLGINDSAANSKPLTSNTVFFNNMQALINNAQLSGDVILLGFVPSTGLPQSVNEPDKYSILFQLAQINNIPLINTWRNFNGPQSPSTWMYDALHPNNIGYQVLANSVNEYLQSVAC